MSKLWYRQYAQKWDEALPLGNGKLGAMFFGATAVERVQLNEETIWYGRERERNNPDAKDNLAKVRNLILSGNVKEAETIMKYAFSGVPQSQRTYQSLGDATITVNHENVEGYIRELILDDALGRVRYSCDNVNYEREYLISSPDNVIAINFRADKERQISFDVILTRERFYDGVKKRNDGILLYGNLSKGAPDFAIEAKVVSDGGKVKIIGEHIVVTDANSATLYITGGSTLNRINLEEELDQIINNAVNKGYDKVKEAHIKDYKSYYDRVDFKLNDMEDINIIPTNIQLLRCKAGVYSNALFKTYFDFGRYLLISSSREGTYPANLQGIWNEKMKPSWDSKYTLNINLEMNYWPAEMCNLSECHMPLFEHIKRMVPHGRITASKMYGCRGFVAHHNTDIYGDTAVVDHWLKGSYWVMGAAWLCTHIWTHYEYTKDKEFLREYYPIMKEACEFFVDFLIEDNGYLKTCPSVSPENSYRLDTGEVCSNSVAVTMDNEILRDLFSDCKMANEILNINDGFDITCENIIGKLPELKIGKYGQIMEWQEDYEEFNPGHRHISHLYALYPSEQILKGENEELCNAAKVTLQRRLDNGGGHTGWSRAWIINFFALLWDSEGAYENLCKLMEISTLSNLFDNHPPFQIDGNFGGITGICNMIIQSTSKRVVLLPALPTKWHTGSLKGIRIKGGGEVDLEWKDNSLTLVKIKAKCGDFKTKLIYKETKRDVEIKCGETLIIRDL